MPTLFTSNVIAATPRPGKPAISFAAVAAFALLLPGTPPGHLPAVQTQRNTERTSVPARVGMWVETHRSAAPGSVNAHLIITSKGIILVDALRTTSEATKLEARIHRAGRPLLAILITHAHPDHFGGLRHLAGAFPKVPVHATPEVYQALREDQGATFARPAKR